MAKDRKNAALPAADVETWVFDLDNTLYQVPPAMHLEIDRRMGAFVSEFLGIDAAEARKVQKSYFRQYGLTLRGLMVKHGLDPAVFEDHMSGLDLSQIEPDRRLLDAIDRLPGRKVIYTNAFASHAVSMLDFLSMSEHFDAIYDIQAADYKPKPALESYHALCALHGIDARSAVMVDDIPGNLAPAAEIGMTTVWVRTKAAWARDVESGPHIHHQTDDIADWLSRIDPPC